MSGEHTVHLFVLPLHNPCGEKSTCCGPVGQTEEEIAAYRDALAEVTGTAVEVVDTRDEEAMAGFPTARNLVRAFGLKAIPTVALDADVVAMGPPTPADAAAEVTERLKAHGTAGD